LTLEQLSEVQASLDRATRGRVVAEERYKHFQGEYKKMVVQLKDAKAKADDYLHQLSFASRVQNAAWSDGLHLGFETFRTWWKDSSWKIDLDQVNVEDVPCTSETMRRMTNLSREEMPDVVGIIVFDYHPPVEDFEATLEGAPDKEAVEDDGAAPIAQDPLLFPRRSIFFFSCTNFIIHLYIPNYFNNKRKVSFCFLLASLFLFFPLKITTITFDEF
jgi:hypothetical protein